MCDAHLFCTPFKLGDSCIWRAITKAAEILRSRFICPFGKGCH